MKLIEKQKQERRRRILEAARGCFMARELEAVTMKDLAEAAGVSVPTLYNLFGGKEDLLFATIEDQFEALLEGLDGTRAGSGARAVFGVLEACSSLLIGGARYTRTLMSLLTTTGGRHIQSTLRVALSRELETAIERAQRSGDLQTWVQAALLAAHVRDAYLMAAFHWGVDGGDDAGLQLQGEYIAAMAMLGVSQTDTLRAELERRAKKAQRSLARREAQSSRAR